MVKRLETCLTTSMDFTLVGREVRVALDHFGPAFHHPDDDTLARRAGAAQAGIPIIASSDQILRQLDRALDMKLSFPYAKALTGYGSHRT